MDNRSDSAPPLTATSAASYHPVLKVLHWVLAVLLIAALAQGTLLLKQTSNVLPAKLTLLRVHMAVGSLILALTLIRLAVTALTPHPPTAFPRSIILSRLVRAVHGFLYLLVLSMVATGIGIAVGAGLPEIVFRGVGGLPDTFDELAARQLHGVVAKLLIVTASAHILAASYHQFIRKDGLMRRMFFHRKTAPSAKPKC